MKKVEYNYDDIVTLTSLINSLTITGIQAARQIAACGNILDKGLIKDTDTGGKKE